MTYLFQNDENLSNPICPDGFQFLRYSPGLEPKWLDVLNQSGEFGVWDVSRLSKVMLRDLLPECGVIIVNHNNEPVACSAICYKKGFEPMAVLMYVIVLSQYRGHGLAKAMVLDGLVSCRRLNIPGVALLTDDFRLPAIGLYMKLGFAPDFTASPDALIRWERILNHVQG